VKRGRLLFLAPLLLAACGDLQGFGGPAPPLATLNVVFHGDLASLRPANVSTHALRVALVWGAQWLTEPFCVLPAESMDVAPVIEAGCRDTFGFVPAAVSVSAPITVDVPTTLTLSQLPGADVMVGDVTARVAYGSLVLFDDYDDSGTLELSMPHRLPSGGRREEDFRGSDSRDVIYGASFFTMTAPDQRLAYREGEFDMLSAFYPRAGCDPPPRGFSVLAASGFSEAAALAATLAGQLPPETYPSDCLATQPPADATITIQAQTPPDVVEVGCDERTADSSIRYREPPTNDPGLAIHTWACAHLPTFDTGGSSPASSLIQLVVASGPPEGRCKGLTHYTLRGCREDVNCPVPDWDFTASRPAWWPCGQ
jgi:hypothetical protein